MSERGAKFPAVDKHFLQLQLDGANCILKILSPYSLDDEESIVGWI